MKTVQKQRHRVEGIRKTLEAVGVERLKEVNDLAANGFEHQRIQKLNDIAKLGCFFGFLHWSDTKVLLSQEEAGRAIIDSFRRVTQAILAADKAA